VEGRRTLHAHTFCLVVELVTAGDIDLPVLALTLTQLATAGLAGMVASITKASLDGQDYEPSQGSPDKSIVRSLRPPPDERLTVAIRNIEKALDHAKDILYGSRSVA